MAILAKKQKRHEGKSEREGCSNPLLRERVKLYDLSVLIYYRITDVKLKHGLLYKCYDNFKSSLFCEKVQQESPISFKTGKKIVNNFNKQGVCTTAIGSLQL